MANPILTSDIYKDDNTLKKLIKELERVIALKTELVNKEVAAAAKIEAALKKTTSATVGNRKEIEESAKQVNEIAKRHEKLTASLNKNAIEIESLKAAQTKLNAINKLEAKILNSKEGSYDRLSAQYSINKIKLNQLSKEERNATKAGQELEKQTNDIYQEMKRLQEATGKTSLNVGNYKDATAGLVDQLQEMPGVLGAASSAANQLGSQFKALLKNPVVLIIATIAGALIGLFRAFGRSEKGAQLFAKATGFLNGILSQITNLSVVLAEKLEYAFNNPREALSNLGKSLVQNLVNRLTALPLLAKAALDSLKALWNRDMDALKTAGENAFFAVSQAITGLSEADQRNFAKAVSETTKEIAEQTNKFIKLEEQKRAVIKSNRELVKSIEQLTTIEQLNQSLADDATKSFEERVKASEEARKATEARSKKEIQLAKNNLSVINTELSLRKANGEQVEDLLDRQLDAYRELAGAEREYTLAVRENEKVRSELKQDELEKDLDILIDGFDNQKTINERRLADDRITLEERAKILLDTQNLAESSFAKQIETIEKFTNANVNANDLIMESDAVVLNEKIRSLGLSEIIEGRLLEIIRERRIATQDLNDAERALAEANRSERTKDFALSQLIAETEFESVKRTEEEKSRFVIDQKQKELEEIKRMNAEFDGLLPPIDSAELEVSIQKLSNDLSKAIKETRLNLFDEEQAFAQSEFDLLDNSERNKTKFRLNAERERLQKIIDLNKEFGSDLSIQQLNTIKNQIALIDAEIQKTAASRTDIYDLLGFNISDEKKQAITQAIGTIKDSLKELTSAWLEAADAAVSASETQVQQAQNQVAIETANRNAGQAHKLQTAEKELASAKRVQDKALREQKKAAQAQAAIQTIEQSVSLTTASAKIWSSFTGLGPIGPVLAVGAIGAMWASFLAAKIRASKLAKKIFAKGGMEVIGGGTHASGDDTYLGFESEGKPAYAEVGEAHIIVPASKTKKYRAVLPGLVKSLQSGTLDKFVEKMAGEAVSDNGKLSLNYSSSSTVDTRKIEDDLGAIRKRQDKSVWISPDGKIRKYKNLTTNYE